MEGFADSLLQRNLDQERIDQKDRDNDQKEIDDGAADIPDDEQPQRHEGKIDHRGDGKGGDEIADTFELLEILCERADGFGADLHSQIEDLLEEHRRDLEVRLVARLVHEITPQAAHHDGEEIDHRDSDGEHPERLHRMVGDDPVIDDHNEEGAHEAEGVDQKGGDQDIPIDAPGLEDGPPEPVLC